MKCNLEKCSKTITNTYNCNKCDKMFCSNTCMIDHVFKSHQTTQDTGKKSNFTIKKQTTIKSPFIHQGEFLKEIENDPYYDYENFEYVMDLKTGKKKLIGAGAFGEVFLTKNKLDNKYQCASSHEVAVEKSLKIQKLIFESSILSESISFFKKYSINSARIVIDKIGIVSINLSAHLLPAPIHRLTG